MKILEIYLGLDISVMQNNKFPPNIIYLFYSFITVFVALWLKEKLKNISVNNFFARVGRSAILFYFCQGISSSLLFWIAPKMQMMWWIKLPIAFCINLFLAIMFVWILQQFFNWEKMLEVKLKKLYVDI